jgi:hypothetical protein
MTQYNIAKKKNPLKEKRIKDIIKLFSIIIAVVVFRV